MRACKRRTMVRRKAPKHKVFGIMNRFVKGKLPTAADYRELKRYVSPEFRELPVFIQRFDDGDRKAFDEFLAFAAATDIHLHWTIARRRDESDLDYVCKVSR